MKWVSESLNYAEYNKYVLVDFALSKETEKAIRIKIDRSVLRLFSTIYDKFYKSIRIEGICIWIPKSCVRNYTDKKAFINLYILRSNVTKESVKHIQDKFGLNKEEILDVKLSQ